MPGGRDETCLEALPMSPPKLFPRSNGTKASCPRESEQARADWVRQVEAWDPEVLGQVAASPPSPDLQSQGEEM